MGSDHRSARRIILVSLALIAASPAAGQTAWRSTLYPADWTPPTALRFETDRLIQDFSYAGYRRGEAEIPLVRGPVFDVTAYGADPTGIADSTAAIQNAINAATAAGGGVVWLPAGTFRISPQGTNPYALRIAAANLVLRGAGRDHTFLFNDSFTMRGKHIIRVEGSTSGWSTVPAGSPQTRLTADLPGPTTSIPVASTTGFAVGDWIILRADATDAFIAEHNMTDLWAGLGSGLGGVMCQRQITGLDAANARITIDVPTRYYLKTRDNARIHRAVPHVEEVGLEDFSLGNREHAAAGNRTGWAEEDYNTETNGSYDTHGSFAIALRRARHCWITNVGSYRPAANTLNTHLLSNGILLENCRGVTVRNCDFQRPLYGGGGGNGYMYRLQASNECLIRDSAARYNRHGFVFSHMACSGNVIHGGIAQVTRTQAAGAGTTSGEGCDHHMHLSQSNLIDGVQLDRDFFTAHYRGTSGTPPQHGQGAAHSVYWNLEGLAYQPGKNYIVRSEQARYGYMIGTRGPASGMTTTSGAPAARTAPVDHAEGAGLGLTLQPFSLYQDQLARRLAREVVPPPPATVTATAGPGQVALAWSAVSPATGYQVRWAPAPGGPFELLVTTDTLRHTDMSLPGGTARFYAVSALNPAGEGLRSAVVSATPGAASPPAVAPAARVVNLATRALVGGSAGMPIAGVVVGGTGAKRLLIRAVGPGLAAFGVTGTLPNPDIAIVSRGATIVRNDNWLAADATTFAQVGAFSLPANSADAAVVHSLLPEAYTTSVGVAGGSGILLLEVYDADPANLTAALVNASIRAYVGQGDAILIPGFAVAGPGTARVLLRAVGPTLGPFGVSDALIDPQLVLYRGTTVVGGNDNWSTSANAAEIAAAAARVGAFPLPSGSRDAVLLLALPAGPYTVNVSGVGGATGTALIETYLLP
jgi:hypothetical protein